VFARWEWLLIDFVVMGWLVYELLSNRRAIRRDRAARRERAGAREPAAGGEEPPGG